MIRDFLIFLFTTFVVDPFQAELNQKLAAAQAPPAIVAEVSQCARTATPILADRAMSDPWWAASTVIGVWLGTTSAESALTDAAPACGTAVRAARPFLTGS
jgi:hypothetical protein